MRSSPVAFMIIACFGYAAVMNGVMYAFSSRGLALGGLVLRHWPAMFVQYNATIMWALGLVTILVFVVWAPRVHGVVRALIALVMAAALFLIFVVSQFLVTPIRVGMGENRVAYRDQDGQVIVYVYEDIPIAEPEGYYVARGPVFRDREMISEYPLCGWTDVQTGDFVTDCEAPGGDNDDPQVDPSPTSVPTVDPGTPTGELYYSVSVSHTLSFKAYASASAPTLQRSTDGGVTWETVANPPGVPDSECWFVQEISQLDDGRLKAVTGCPSWIPDETDVRVSFSDDEGESWVW